ncbi:hypothetical protein ACFW4G_03685 [Paenibacillus lactis]|uniref:hypothetical protein n=1 Tax=Paenibacillus lactis TaxID=228574 RepID=UPI00367D4DDF
MNILKRVGRKIFYDKTTGEIIVNAPSQEGTQVYDAAGLIQVYPILRERDPETYGVIDLEFGQYEEDFAQATHCRVNLDTLTLEFSYPDPNEPEAPPVFQKPLTQEIEELKQENTLLKAQNSALTERTEFIEDVIAEMAQQVYQ